MRLSKIHEMASLAGWEPTRELNFKISDGVCKVLQHTIHDYCKNRLDGCVGKVVYDD